MSQGNISENEKRIDLKNIGKVELIDFSCPILYGGLKQTQQNCFKDGLTCPKTTERLLNELDVFQLS